MTEPIVIGRGAPDGIPEALRTAFVALLGTTPPSSPRSARTCLSVTAQFAHPCVPPDGDDGAGLDVLLPIVFLPPAAYGDELPARLAGAISGWVQAQEPGDTADGRIVLELRVFPDSVSTSSEPLVTLARLEYLLASRSPVTAC